ncbi:HipA domain-containing protein [Azohydromonas aeria]|uniref:HipA domain-containing protein n=1 Tax=Azohydromonas aeria TaxID=2590212 RepID=UPI0012F79F44|nr:HipA domain-containing protein [Azohydromonas aeria]
MPRTLEVLLDGRRLVGSLHENDDVWRFDYDPDWARDPQGFDLAPGLPRSGLSHVDGGTNRPVQWYFDNLLPEEGARLLLSQEARVDQADAFALLEYLGAESAGSLVLQRPGAAVAEGTGLRPLPDEELCRRIRLLPRVPLSHGAPKRMSAAGAQHKLLVVLRDGELCEPVGGQASTHILKPDNRLPEYPATVANEYLMMRLAAKAGLAVPRVHLRYTPEPVYIVERFDRRTDADGHTRRLHAVDACQLLNRSRAFKYQEATLANLAALARCCRNRAAARIALYRWLVFNVLIANGDNHLKNLSFLVSPEGVELAPAYDLLCTGVYDTRAMADEAARWPQTDMPIQLPGARTFGAVTRQALLDAGEAMELPPAICRREVERLVRAVPAGLADLADEFERSCAALASGPALPFLASQRRLMNAIRHVVVADIIGRLK